MQWVEPGAAGQVLIAPKASDDPLHAELTQAEAQLAEARARLAAHLARLVSTEDETSGAKQQLAVLTDHRLKLEAQLRQLDQAVAERGSKVGKVVFSAEELQQRGKNLLEEIKALEATPAAPKLLRYHAPVSQAVRADEMFFECKEGRVTFIDLPAFLHEVRTGLDDRANELKAQWQVTHTTAPVGAFRMRYTLEREKGALDALGGAAPAGGNFRYGLAEWVVEPVALRRGEALAEALAEGSEFRRLVDRLDPRLTVVTFWFYADSFELFRQLRDHLYERDIEVAGRPLPDDASIAASRHGTASRSQ
jgi:hypothetical protein